MKIDNGSLPPTPDRLGQSSAVTSSDGAPRAATGTPATGDAVRVSGEAQLVAQAATAVGDVGGQDHVRPDVVERAKEALARGEVGADLDRLADRLIDGMLDE
jgi:flagellar biosynthesis anti-sigma factor FlgM